MKLRKMTPEEVELMTTTDGKGARRELWDTYNALLSEMVPNEWTAIDLSEGDTKQKVRQQLNLAAQRAGVTIQYKITRKPTIYAKVVSGEPVPPPEIPIVAQDMEKRIDADDGEVTYY